MAKPVSWIRDRLGVVSPSLWDNRNYSIRRATRREAEQLPHAFKDLLDWTPTDFPSDQGDIGSCVGWGGNFAGETVFTLTALYTDRQDLIQHVDINFSAGWLYYWSKEYSVPPIPQDQPGSTVFGLVKAMNKKGIALESSVPTDTLSPWDGITYDEKDEANAMLYKIDEYWNVPSDPASLKAAMYGVTHDIPYDMPDGSPGKAPLVCAWPVYEDSINEAMETGFVPIPEDDDRLLGGHCTVLYAWESFDGVDCWTTFNSWGRDVGDNGKFYLPLNYPFYPNDFWLGHMGKSAGGKDGCPGTCIIEHPSSMADLMNWFDNSDKQYYYGREYDTKA